MRVLTLAATAIVALVGASPASADPDAEAPAVPPFVDHTQWAQWNQLPSLRVYPTASGRAAARQFGSAGADADEAWSEVLAQAPDAATPGMREQFLCHWELAEVVEPGKISWNLEPWRPVVDAATMVGSGCNPGGSEESF
ncbi:DUF2599 domain-containing protein [Mycobacterium sp.]|uniref:DUF2599 domain-containing protein n=1 Tax=Mycobacterium sp. TaxID=1785 RepID=UPI003C784B59